MSTRPALSTSGTLAAILVSVLAPFALGYFLSYLFRAVNAVVGPNLAADLGLSAAELGLLTSAYLFAFALFQLPLGVLLDRFGRAACRRHCSPAPPRGRCCLPSARTSRS